MTSIAILKSDSPFHPLFPEGVPIKNIFAPVKVNCTGDGIQDVYFVDLDKLSEEKFLEVATLVVIQCASGVPIFEAMAEMRERGLPLRAKHIAWVSIDSRAFL
jgi:hypothetical protein